MVDGDSNDPAWMQARGTEVRFGNSGDLRLELKAAVHEGSLYLLITWPDPTETTRNNPHMVSGPDYLWRENSMGDSVLVNLPLQGSFFDGTDVAPDSKVDFWRWTPHHGSRSGHVEDGVLPLRSWFTKEGGWYPGLLYMGTLKADEPGTKRDGGDVLAQGRWKDGSWTVEFARALSTGQPDDRDLAGLAEIPIRVVVSDRGEGNAFGSHGFSDTPVLRLLLPPPVPEDQQGPFPDPRGGPRERR